jgi:cyclohexadieny/prephenate dehydrogenase
MSAKGSKAPMFEKAAILGVGLIGSSLALAMRRHGLAETIVGCTRSVASRDKVLALGLADEATQDPAAAVEDADLIVICTPVGTYEEIGRAIETKLRPGAIVTDAGSVKQAVMRDLGPFIPEGVHFVPGHPIAGSEKSGPESGFAELFEDRWCILTPPPGTNADAIEKVSALWQACGAMVTTMDARHHDRVLAITSHLPHLIAYTIVSTAGNTEEDFQGEVAKYSAGGFRDFTRIAASDPIMWRDIFLNNREAVLEMLQRFSEDLTALQRAIRWGEGEVLEDMFRRARDARRQVLAEHQAGTFDPREPDSN